MDVTFSGMVTDVRDTQPLKAPYPIDIRLSGMVTDVTNMQESNAPWDMLSTPSGTATAPVFPDGQSNSDLPSSE